jgi:hypothetical protein
VQTHSAGISSVSNALASNFAALIARFTSANELTGRSGEIDLERKELRTKGKRKSRADNRAPRHQDVNYDEEV